MSSSGGTPEGSADLPGQPGHVQSPSPQPGSPAAAEVPVRPLTASLRD